MPIGHTVPGDRPLVRVFAPAFRYAPREAATFRSVSHDRRVFNATIMCGWYRLCGGDFGYDRIGVGFEAFRAQARPPCTWLHRVLRSNVLRARCGPISPVGYASPGRAETAGSPEFHAKAAGSAKIGGKALLAASRSTREAAGCPGAPASCACPACGPRTAAGYEACRGETDRQTGGYTPPAERPTSSAASPGGKTGNEAARETNGKVRLARPSISARAVR